LPKGLSKYYWPLIVKKIIVFLHSLLKKIKKQLPFLMPTATSSKIPEPISPWWRVKRRQSCTRNIIEKVPERGRLFSHRYLVSSYFLLGIWDETLCSCFYSKISLPRGGVGMNSWRTVWPGQGSRLGRCVWDPCIYVTIFAQINKLSPPGWHMVSKLKHYR